MGFFDLFRKKPPEQAKPAATLDGWWPIYSQFGTDIYASDVVQQALKCIVDEVKKLTPKHIRQKDGDSVPVASELQNVLDFPNERMTASEFWEKVTWLLLLNYNAFIIPVYDEERAADGIKRHYLSLWPINPSEVDFIEDARGTLFVSFTFRNGYKTTIPYRDVIHIKYNFAVSEYMGGNEQGQPDQKAILKTLDLNHELLQGIAKSMKASYAINGIIKYNTIMDNGKMENAVREFSRMIENSESGFLPVDMKSEVIPFQRTAALVDAQTLKFVDDKILRNWGVPLCILEGSYTKEQYEAFFQKTISPLALSMSQAASRVLFTQNERARGNRVMLYPKQLVFMTTSQILEMIKELSPTGTLFENEKRTALGLAPLPQLEGQRYMSLNWIAADLAREYQVGITGGQTPPKEEEKDGI